MSERIFSENPNRFYDRALVWPLTLAICVASGMALRVEPFSTHRLASAVAVVAFLLCTIAYRMLASKSGERTLRINESTVSFSTDGLPITLFWHEVYSIDCEMVQRGGIETPVVTVRARKTGTIAQDIDRHIIDFSYGLTPQAMCEELRQHLNVAIKKARMTPDQASRKLTHQIGFGRRATDRGSANIT